MIFATNIKVVRALLFVVSSVLFMSNYAAADCVSWKHLKGLGGEKMGTESLCASRASDTVAQAEKCQPDEYLCSTTATITGNQTCSKIIPLPWKVNLPAGESCTNDLECFYGKCITIEGKSKCEGKKENEECKSDLECNPRLYCNKNNKKANPKCTPVIVEGKECNATARCEFSTLCNNKNCTKVATLEIGDKFSLLDDELFPKPTPTGNFTYIHRMCKSFFAVNTNERTKEGNDIFQCAHAPVANFTDYSRSGSNQTCEFSIKLADGQVLRKDEYAACGFNEDTKSYCPKRMGDVYDSEKLAFVDTWGSLSPKECHHRTTIQYCPQIEDNPITSAAFRLYMRRDWETTDNNWSLIANHDREVGNAISATKNYWRIRDAAYTAAVSSVIVATGVLVSLVY